MNAKEFKLTLAELGAVTDRVSKATGYTADVMALNRIRHTLDEHRLEMEAGEAKGDRSKWRQCERCAVAMTSCRENELLCPQCRLDTIERKYQDLNVAVDDLHPENLERIEQRLDKTERALGLRDD